MKTKLVIFGITGDLSRRKLLPALEHIITADQAGDLSIIGVSRREVDIPELLSGSIGHDRIADAFSTFTMDLASKDDYVSLKEYIELEADEQLLVYLSVPPSAAADIADFLGEVGLNGANVKLLFEKPFGFDLDTAKEFIERTKRYFEDAQLYRIDHYAAKEFAAEIVRLRTTSSKHGNWNGGSIASIDVVASEAIGIEDRALFYEETGALRDFVQGHLMQILALVIMDIPADFDSNQTSIYRLKALQQLAEADPIAATRAQYEGYQQEVSNVGSLTETFASLALTSNDEKWQGVQMRLTTGKALNEKRSYVCVTYKDGSELIIEEGKIKSSDERLPDAYERVLLQAMQGSKSIFTTGPEVIRSWEIVQWVQQAWSFDDQPLKQYPKGSSIPDILA